jgi:thiamine-monophosphate kinase
MSPADVGYKALAVNLSDLAAMGAEPCEAFGVLGVPPSATVEQLDGLLAGIRDLAEASRIRLAGGDTVAAPQWIIGFTVTGRVKGTGLPRSAARPGDLLWHSGELGLSQRGLELLEQGARDPENSCIRAHARPRPQLELGRFLLDSGLASACIDLSDSLSQCALQLARASGVGLELDFSNYEFSPQLGFPTCAEGSSAGAEKLLASAEDFQLLFCAPETSSDRLTRESPVKLTRLGRIVESGAGCRWLGPNQDSFSIKSSGFSHF